MIYLRHLGFLMGLSLLCLLLYPCPLQAQGRARVTIQGLDGILHDNVASALKSLEQEGLSEQHLRRLHRKAEETISRALQPFGYYSPTIEKSLDQEKDGWHATYRIEVGEPVRVTELIVTFEGGEVKTFLPGGVKFPLASGDRLDHRSYTEGKKKLLRRLLARGYVQAQYSESRMEVNVDTKSCRIVLKIVPGPRFVFGETRFHQDVLSEELLRKFLNYSPGEPYSAQRLLQLEQILYGTGYFNSVSVRGDIKAAENQAIPVVIELDQPKHRNRYRFGIGWATDDGMRGTVSWKNKLLNQYGHTYSVELQLAENESGFDSTYGVPINDPLHDTMYFGLNWKKESWDDTDTDLKKGSIYFEHEGYRFRYGAGFEVRDEDYTVGVTSGDSLLSLPYLNWTVLYGDSYVDTTHGIMLSVGVKGAMEDMISDTSFLQVTASGKIITTLLPGLRFIGRFQVGRIYSDDFDEIPPSLRFYAGGDMSVRGYDYKSLGPTDDSGTVVGGEYLLVGSAELEKTLWNNWSVATFFDAGNAMDDISIDLAEGAGVGVRYRLPFGQVRLDVASALSEDGRPLKLHFTVGGDL